MLLSKLRKLAWSILGEPPVAVAVAAPVGISADGLPLHLSPPECPVCAELTETLRLRQAEFLSRIPESSRPLVVPPHFCDDCGTEIKWSPDKSGNGFQSQSANHGHLHQSSSGGWMKSKAYRELCPDCYRLDWATVYKEAECPV